MELLPKNGAYFHEEWSPAPIPPGRPRHERTRERVMWGTDGLTEDGMGWAYTTAAGVHLGMHARVSGRAGYRNPFRNFKASALNANYHNSS